MYQHFFGFNRLPFKLTPDVRTFFPGAHRQEMVEALLYAVERGEGLITVVGEVGTGKTTIARVLADRFHQSMSIISVFTPNISAYDMLRLIAEEAQLDIEPAASKLQIMQAIRAHCLSLHREGKRFLLLIDEAQTMLLETIEELRLLSNMQLDDTKLVQVMLFGQPELDHMLNSSELRQVKDRVVFQLHLEPFSREELADYLEFRLQQAGYLGSHFFSAAVIDAIFQKTQGFPRAVNRLTDQSLMAAFAEQTHQLMVHHVTASVQEAVTPFDETLIKSNRWQNIKSLTLVKQPTKVWAFVGLTLLVLSFGFVLNLWSGQGLEKKQPNELASIGHTETQAGNPSLIVAPVQSAPKAMNELTDSGLVVSEVRSIERMHDFASKNVLILQPAQYGVDQATWSKLHHEQLELFTNYAKENKYSIQLMSSPWRLKHVFVEQVNNLLVSLPNLPAFYYDYSASLDRPRIGILYGVYDSSEDAKQALAILKESNLGYRPDVISFKQIVGFMSASQVLVN